MSQRIYGAWRRAGFLPAEAQELTYGTGNVDAEVVFNSIPGSLARASRREWIRGLTARDWTKEEIKAGMLGYYRRDRERSPWDFIKIEYKPREVKDYQEAARRRSAEHLRGLRRSGYRSSRI